MHQWKNKIQNKYQFRNAQLKKNETKLNMKKLIVMDILTYWKQNGVKNK